MPLFETRIRHTRTWEFYRSIEADDEDEAQEKAEDYIPTEEDLCSENEQESSTQVLDVEIDQSPRFIVISPDGIPIAPVTYETKALAEIALQAWCEHYRQQGYYAGASGRISLADLPSQCKIETA